MEKSLRIHFITLESRRMIYRSLQSIALGICICFLSTRICTYQESSKRFYKICIQANYIENFIMGLMKQKKIQAVTQLQKKLRLIKKPVSACHLGTSTQLLLHR